MAKKKVYAIIFGCLIFPTLTISQSSKPLPLPRQIVDVEKIKLTGQVKVGIPLPLICKDFVCEYPYVRQPLIWIPPLKDEWLASIDSLAIPTFEFYKESETLPTLHPRMRSDQKTVYNLLAGVSYEVFNLQDTSKASLISILHENGLRSWYYPVIPDTNIDPRRPGSVIGTSNSGYFWQLRYMNRSILLTGLLDGKWHFDPKGIFIENLPEKYIDPNVRYFDFIRNFRKRSPPIQINQNFSSDFINQIDSKQN